MGKIFPLEPTPVRLARLRARAREDRRIADEIQRKMERKVILPFQDSRPARDPAERVKRFEQRQASRAALIRLEDASQRFIISILTVNEMFSPNEFENACAQVWFHNDGSFVSRFTTIDALGRPIPRLTRLFSYWTNIQYACPGERINYIKAVKASGEASHLAIAVKARTLFWKLFQELRQLESDIYKREDYYFQSWFDAKVRGKAAML